MSLTSHSVTQMLLDWSEGDREALDKLIPLVYSELRLRAARYLRRERPGHTLQTTALNPSSTAPDSEWPPGSHHERPSVDNAPVLSSRPDAKPPPDLYRRHRHANYCGVGFRATLSPKVANRNASGN